MDDDDDDDGDELVGPLVLSSGWLAGFLWLAVNLLILASSLLAFLFLATGRSSGLVRSSLVAFEFTRYLFVWVRMEEREKEREWIS